MSGLRVGSLFSGVEGIGQGLEAAGFEVAWQVEIDQDAVSVLERHYPTVRRYRDVREIKGADLGGPDIHPCLAASTGGPASQDWQAHAAVIEGMSVRRLMPVECEALMGWERDWTRYRADGSEIPDGPRYRMIGNGVVAPVARWIGKRLRRAIEGPS